MTAFYHHQPNAPPQGLANALTFRPGPIHHLAAPKPDPTAVQQARRLMDSSNPFATILSPSATTTSGHPSSAAATSRTALAAAQYVLALQRQHEAAQVYLTSLQVEQRRPQTDFSFHHHPPPFTTEAKTSDTVSTTSSASSPPTAHASFQSSSCVSPYELVQPYATAPLSLSASPIDQEQDDDESPHDGEEEEDDDGDVDGEESPEDALSASYELPAQHALTTSKLTRRRRRRSRGSSTSCSLKV